jgi:hypothetical protein
MPVRVAIDTSVFRRDPRLRSGSTEALARFAESGYVTILVPEVVAKEFKSLPADKAQAAAGLRKALTELRRGTPEEFASTIDKFEADVDDEFRRIEVESETIFNAWVARTKATFVGASNDHAQRVLIRYFDGTLPFKSKKSRGDFPDAFIVEVLLDLAAEEELFVVTGDKRMIDALADKARITVVPDLKTLLELDEFDEVRSEVEATNVPHALQWLKENIVAFDDDVEKGVTSLLSGTRVRYYGSWDEESRGESLFIEQIGHVIEWSIHMDGAEYLGEGVISVPFGCTIEVELEEPSDRGYSYGDEYFAPSPMEAILEITGTSSLVVRHDDLADPAVKQRIDDIMEHSRIEVDALDSVTIKKTDRERW